MGAIRRSGRRHAGRPEELSQLTGSQLELVRLLRRRPGISVNQVADELNLAPNTVSTLVRQLVDAGFVVRRLPGGRPAGGPARPGGGPGPQDGSIS